MNLILLGEDELLDGADVTLSDARARHLLTVLRVSPGQQLRVGRLDGPQGIGTVQACSPERVHLRCVFDARTPERPPVDLLLAVPRPKVLQRLWPQLAALGVGRIILTNAERVERPYFDTHVLTEACYRPLLIEGLQQAKDTRLPVVSVHRQFRILIEDHLPALFADGMRLVAQPGAAPTVAGTLRGLSPTRLLLAVGPEGGWNAFELALLERHGFLAVGLGGRTLRVDTACIALLGLAHAALQETPSS